MGVEFGRPYAKKGCPDEFWEGGKRFWIKRASWIFRPLLKTKIGERICVMGRGWILRLLGKPHLSNYHFISWGGRIGNAFPPPPLVKSDWLCLMAFLSFLSSLSSLSFLSLFFLPTPLLLLLVLFHVVSQLLQCLIWHLRSSHLTRPLPKSKSNGFYWKRLTLSQWNCSLSGYIILIWLLAHGR